MIKTNGAYRVVAKMEQGQEVLYFSRFKSRGIWKLANSKMEISKILAETTRNGFINWYPAQHGIYFLRWEEGQQILYFYNYQNQRYTRLLFVGDIIPGFLSLQFSSDEKELFLTKTEGVNADIVMESL